MTLLNEIADYNESGSWGRLSEGWPEVTGDIAKTIYITANKTKLIPYGSYVLMSERGKYGATETVLRVHVDHIDTVNEFINKTNTLDALDAVYNEVRKELEFALNKFPTWPTRALDAVAVLNEEVGELNKEVLQMTYEPHKTNKDEIKKEAIQAAAMTFRFLLSLDDYDYIAGEQHSQSKVVI